MKRILVTGATGFIGRHVLPYLVDRGYDIHVAGRRSPHGPVSGVTHHPCDLLAEGESRLAVEAVAPSHLLHLAWNAQPGRFWTALDNLDWVAASLRFYRAFAEAGGVRAVFAGTCAEYDWASDLMCEANTPVAPHTLYGKAKNALRQLVEETAHQTGVRVAWGRIFSLYGPYEPPKRLVPDVITALLEGKPVLCSHGNQQRDYMHVDDVARAFVEVMESDYTGPVNIATGETVPLRRIIYTIAGIIGRPDLVRLGARPAPPGDPDRLAASVDLLRNQVRFTPRHDLDAGLAETVAWWRQRCQGCDAGRS